MAIGNVIAPNNNTGLYNQSGVNIPTNTNFNIPGNLSVGGNITGNGYLSIQGNITSNGYLFGNAAYLTGLPEQYGNANVAAYLPINTSNVQGNNFVTTGSPGTGNITGANYVQANFYLGDGGLLSNIQGIAGNYSNANVSTYLPTYVGNLGTANTTPVTAIFTDGYYYANGTPFAGGNYGNANVAAYLPTYTGNVQAGNVTTIGNTGNITGANLVVANAFLGSGANLDLTNMNGHIIPGTNSVFSLGNVTNQWKELWVSGNTIYLGEVPVSMNSNTLQVANSNVLASSELYQNGNLYLYGNIGANLFLGNINGANIVGEVAVANIVSNPLQPTITQVGVLTALTTGTLDVTGQLTANANAQFNGNVYFAGNVDIAGNINQISGNSGQFFGNAQTGFDALYAGVPAGYNLLVQEVTQFSSNYNGYAQVNNRNINGGDQATTDYVITANDGTDTTNYIDMGIAGSGYNGLLANNSLGNSLFAADGYLYTLGNVTGGNLVLGTAQPGANVRIITGASDLANVRASFNDAGLSVNGNVVANLFTGNGSGLTSVRATASETLQLPVKNTSGTTLLKGTPVYVTGTVGATDVLEIAASDASISSTLPAVAMLEQDLLANDTGYAISVGTLLAVNTNAYAVGDELYVAVGGGITNVRPVDGYTAQTVGSVGRVGTNTGSILVNIYDAYELPNLDTGNIWIGVGNVPVQTNLATYDGNIGAGNVNANFYYGNGAGLTGVVAAAGPLIQNGTSNVSIPTANGNIQFAVGGSNVGYLANNGAVALGPLAGKTPIGANAIAIGYEAGGDSQGTAAVAIGPLAGNATQGIMSIAIGNAAGAITQSTNGIAIGNLAGQQIQGQSAIAIGPIAGRLTQGNFSVAVGASSGYTAQGAQAVAIGNAAGYTSQGVQSVGVGYQAGGSGQGNSAVAIGAVAGYATQGGNAVAVGPGAGQTTQGAAAVAMGFQAGSSAQGATAVAIGWRTGWTNQGANAVAIGYGAGQASQGNNSIAIGTQAGAGSQAANSIVINAGTVALNTGANVAGLFINPIRNNTANVANIVYYNTTTKELTYAPLNYGDANVANLMSNFGSNAISTTGNITANYFAGNGAFLTGIASSYDDANVVTLLSSFGTNTISTLGNVASGNITAGSINTAYTEITTFEADGINITLTFATQGNVPYPAGSKISISGLSLSFPGTDGTYVVQTGTTSTVVINSTYTATPPTAPTSLAIIRGVLNAFVSATGNITTDSYFIGNAAYLTGLPASYGNANVSDYLASGSDTQGFVTSGNVNGQFFNGNGSALTGVTATTLGGFSANVSAVANTIPVRDSNASITANTFIGSGATLTDTNAANITGTYANINIGTGNYVNFAEGATLYSIANGGLAGTAEINGADNRGISVTAGGNIPGSSYSQIQWVEDITNYDPFGYANAITNWVYVQNDGIYFETIDAKNSPGYYHSMTLDTDGLLTVPTGITGNGNIDIGTNNFIGNGALLTGLPATYSNADVSTYLASGNVTTPITTTGNISASYYSGNGSQLSGIINVIPAVNITVGSTGNNQSFSNVILGAYTSNTDITLFYNGSLLTSDYYTLSGDTLTIKTPLFAGDSIDIPQVNVGAVTQTIVSGYGNSNVVSLLNSGVSNVVATGATINGNLLVTGNANVQGTLTYNNTTSITTSNLVLGLGNTQTGVNVTGGGIVVGNTNEASLLYNFSTQSWDSNIGISAVGNITGNKITSKGDLLGVNNIVLGSTNTEGGQITLGWANVGNITGQTNRTWNIDVDNGNVLRAFYQNASGATKVLITADPASNVVSIPSGSLSVSGTITSAAAMFSVYQNSSQSYPAAVVTVVSTDTKEFDTANAFNTSTNAFVAPVSGYYQFNGGVRTNNANNGEFSAVLKKNGNLYKQGTDFIPAGNYSVVLSTVSSLIQLNAGESVQLSVYSNQATTSASGISNTYFNGFFVRGL